MANLYRRAIVTTQIHVKNIKCHETIKFKRISYPDPILLFSGFRSFCCISCHLGEIPIQVILQVLDNEENGWGYIVLSAYDTYVGHSQSSPQGANY